MVAIAAASLRFGAAIEVKLTEVTAAAGMPPPLAPSSPPAPAQPASGSSGAPPKSFSKRRRESSGNGDMGVWWAEAVVGVQGRC